MQPGQPSPMPRRLLARLRDVMAGGGTAQERLQRIVTLIAGDMVAEVCSIYVQRAGEVLELFATQGLRHDAVHRTRLRVGEGLIGDIALSARPYALADAQNHPKFAFRPETGEEIYQSLMGVPILRDGRVIGVLAIQNRTRRHYTEEEVETLQTVAMVLAEMVAGGEVISQDELLPAGRLMPAGRLAPAGRLMSAHRRLGRYPQPDRFLDSLQGSYLSPFFAALRPRLLLDLTFISPTGRYSPNLFFWLP